MAQSSNQAFWSLNGNSPQSGRFLGTINEQPLIFKSNSIEGFRLMPNGFLGIGTSNPTATLDVNGNVIFRDNLFVGGNIEFANSSGFIFPENYVLVLPILELTDYFKVGNSVIITANNHIYSSEDSGPLFIQSQKHDQNTLINWNNEGNVGIGTNNPQRKLHVRSEGRLTAIPIDTTNFERNSIRIEHELYTGGGALFSSSAWDISPGFRGKLHFFSAITNNNVLSLYENGNVSVNNGRLGIGTDNPQAAIDISGDAIINGRLFANEEIVLGENAKFVFPDNYAISFSDLELNNLAVGKTILTDDNHIFTEENSGSLYIQSKEFDQNTIINLGNKGKVGIGTDNPQKKLHIKEIRTFEDEPVSHLPIKDIVFDSVFFNIPVDERDLIISQNERRGSISTELHYTNQAGQSSTSRWDIEPSAFVQATGPIAVKGENKLHFKSHSYSTGNHHTVMTLTDMGTVGIGTMSPGARLHVHNGNIKVTNGRITTDGKLGIGTHTPEALLHIKDGHNAVIIETSGSGSAYSDITFIDPKLSGTLSQKRSWVIRGHADNGEFGRALQIWSPIGEPLLILNTKVSIGGDNNPQFKLDIGGPIRILPDTSQPWTSVGWRRVITTPMATTWATSVPASTHGKYMGYGHTNAGWFWILADGLDAEAQHNYPMSLRIDENGDPRLIIRKSEWSDFVFDENYELMPLHEVETFINEKKHLPQIPKENEIFDNGLDIGEMQKLQMQKIEELTLYIIELNKRLEKLETENQELKNK